jgi:hypothetical protein
VQPVQPEQRGQLVIPVPQERQVLLAQPDLPDQPVLRDQLGLQAQRVLMQQRYQES